MEIYNFTEVFVQAIGKSLGLGYHPACVCDSNIFAPDMPQPVNNTPTGIPPREPFYIDNCTKCAFKALYCPSGVNIHEIPVNPNIIVSPNPTKTDLNISFVINDGIKSVSMMVCNEQGQILETFFSERFYMNGIHN